MKQRTDKKRPAKIVTGRKQNTALGKGGQGRLMTESTGQSDMTLRSKEREKEKSASSHHCSSLVQMIFVLI